MQSPVPTQAALQEARERVTMLTQIVETVRAQVLNERAQGMPSIVAIEQQLATARAQLDTFTAETRTHKDAIKRYRGEIEHWDRWYHTLADIDRDVQRTHLQNEFTWRMNAISQHEAHIAALTQQEYGLIATVQMLQAQLTAIHEGVLDQPVDADPRLLGALESLADARAALAALESSG